LPVLYKDILSFACELAEEEAREGINGVKNYYVMTILMAGVVDDIQCALNEILRARDLPMSVNIIKMGENTGENDSAKLIKKASAIIDNADESYVGFYDFNHYLDADREHTDALKDQFVFDMVMPIVKTVEKYFDLKEFHFEDDSRLA